MAWSVSVQHRIDYYSTWAERYDEQHAALIEDIDFYRELASEVKGPLVEVGAGTGRIAIPIAEDRHPVIALDLHGEMLAIARRKAAGAALLDRLHFATADMRRFILREPTSLVLLTACTFLYNLTMEDQLATLRSCYGALRRGGLLAIHVFNPDLRLIASWLGRSEDDWEPIAGKLWSAWRAEYHPLDQRSTVTYRHQTAEGVVEHASYTLRWVYRNEMEHLLARSGFAVEAVYGDFERSPLSESSPSQIWLARRP